MNNKNAYEIRLAIFEMANASAMNHYYEKISVLKDADNREWEKAVNLADRANAELTIPKPTATGDMVDSLIPSPSSIIAAAKELYSFVEGN